MRPPKLLHLTTTDLTLELILAPQLEAFRDHGYEVVTASAPGPLVAQLTARGGIRHVPLPALTRSVAPWRDLRAVAQVRRLLRDERPDLLHTHNPKTGAIGRLVSPGVPATRVINTVHGLYAQPEDPWLKRKLVYGVERRAARHSDLELVLNPEDRDTLRSLGVPDEKLRLIGAGIDLERFDAARHGEARARLRQAWGVGDEEVVIGTAGRLTREKGLIELIGAMGAVGARHPHAVLVVAGDHDRSRGDALDLAEIAAAEAQGVRFVGFQADIEQFYAALDVFVLASYREGLPYVAMEAAAMGLPLVGTDVRGCRQVVRASGGLLVPPRDAGTLAAALDDLVADPGQRAARGRAAQAAALSQFDQRDLITRVLAAYDEVLPGPPATSEGAP